MEDEAYHCDDCGRYMTKEEAKGDAPECCGHRMRSIPYTECVKDPAFAEHARSFDDDVPCDDGTG